MKTAVISDIGLIRKRNEDSFLLKESLGLFVVCDGMGGHSGGDTASKMAVEIIDEMSEILQSSEPLSFLQEAIMKANLDIWEMAQNNTELFEMGTTITAAVLRENRLTVANIGDSSLFIINSNGISKLTQDHTLAVEMYENGLLNIDEIRDSGYNHILTRALGIEPNVKIDFVSETLSQGDKVLLCSDGLSDLLHEEEILSAFFEYNKGLQDIANKLLENALGKGGHDNITIIVIEI
jgi:protein phosphatase